MKGDMKYYKMFGGEKVIFDKEEVDQMKKFDQPGMRYVYEWNIKSDQISVYYCMYICMYVIVYITRHGWCIVNSLTLLNPLFHYLHQYYISYPLGLVLIGFKPRSRLKRHYYVKPANFLYPDETVSWFSVACTCLAYYVNKLYQVIQGSGKLFTALLRQCLSRDVIAICRYIPRVNASPSFVAMVPQVHCYSDCYCIVEGT